MVGSLPLLGVPELVLISKAKFALLSSAVPSSKEIKKEGGEMGIFGGVEAISVYNRQCSGLKLIQAELFKGQCIIYKPFNLSFKTIFHV